MSMLPSVCLLRDLHAAKRFRVWAADFLAVLRRVLPYNARQGFGMFDLTPMAHERLDLEVNRVANIDEAIRIRRGGKINLAYLVWRQTLIGLRRIGRGASRRINRIDDGQ